MKTTDQNPRIYGYLRMTGNLDDRFRKTNSHLNATCFVEADIIKDAGGLVLRTCEHAMGCSLDESSGVTTTQWAPTLFAARQMMNAEYLRFCRMRRVKYMLVLINSGMDGYRWNPSQPEGPTADSNVRSHIGAYERTRLNWNEVLGRIIPAQPLFG